MFDSCQELTIPGPSDAAEPFSPLRDRGGLVADAAALASNPLPTDQRTTKVQGEHAAPAQMQTTRVQSLTQPPLQLLVREPFRSSIVVVDVGEGDSCSSRVLSDVATIVFHRLGVSDRLRVPDVVFMHGSRPLTVYTMRPCRELGLQHGSCLNMFVRGAQPSMSFGLCGGMRATKSRETKYCNGPDCNRPLPLDKFSATQWNKLDQASRRCKMCLAPAVEKTQPKSNKQGGASSAQQAMPAGLPPLAAMSAASVQPPLPTSAASSCSAMSPAVATLAPPQQIYVSASVLPASAPIATVPASSLPAAAAAAPVAASAPATAASAASSSPPSASARDAQLDVYLSQPGLLPFSSDSCVEARKFRPVFGPFENRILIGGNACGKSSLAKAMIQAKLESKVSRERCIFIPAMFECSLRELTGMQFEAGRGPPLGVSSAAARNRIQGISRLIHHRALQIGRSAPNLRQLFYWLWDPRYLMPPRNLPCGDPWLEQAKAKFKLAATIAQVFNQVFKDRRTLTLHVGYDEQQGAVTQEFDITVSYLDAQPGTSNFGSMRLGAVREDDQIDILSDGERRALYYIMLLVLCFDGEVEALKMQNAADAECGLFGAVIDESNSHLHLDQANSLGRELFRSFHLKRQKQAGIVYFTFLTHAHELDWAKQMQRGEYQSERWLCQVLLVLGHEAPLGSSGALAGHQWRILPIDLQTDSTPLAIDLLFRDLIGANPLLLVEGKPKDTSFDQRLYERLLPEFQVQSQGSCDFVLQAMRSYERLRRHASYVPKEARTRALLDLDRHFSERERKGAAQIGVSMLNVSAAESIVASKQMMLLRTERASRTAVKAPAGVGWPRTDAEFQKRFEEWVELLYKQYMQCGLSEYMQQLRVQDQLREQRAWLAGRAQSDLFAGVQISCLKHDKSSHDYVQRAVAAVPDSTKAVWEQSGAMLNNYLADGRFSFWLDQQANRDQVYAQFGRPDEVGRKLFQAIQGTGSIVQAAADPVQASWRSPNSVPVCAERIELLMWLQQEEQNHRLSELTSPSAIDPSYFGVPPLDVSPGASNHTEVYFSSASPSLLRVIRGHDLQKMFKEHWGETVKECFEQCTQYLDDIEQRRDTAQRRIEKALKKNYAPASSANDTLNEHSRAQSLLVEMRSLYLPPSLQKQPLQLAPSSSQPALPSPGGAIPRPCILRLKQAKQSTLWKFDDADDRFLQQNWKRAAELMLEQGQQALAAANGKRLALLTVVRRAARRLSFLIFVIDRTSQSPVGALYDGDKLCVQLLQELLDALELEAPNLHLFSPREALAWEEAVCHVAFTPLAMITQIQFLHNAVGLTLKTQHALWTSIVKSLVNCSTAAHTLANQIQPKAVQPRLRIFSCTLHQPFFADPRKQPHYFKGAEGGHVCDASFWLSWFLGWCEKTLELVDLLLDWHESFHGSKTEMAVAITNAIRQATFIFQALWSPSWRPASTLHNRCKVQVAGLHKFSQAKLDQVQKASQLALNQAQAPSDLGSRHWVSLEARLTYLVDHAAKYMCTINT